MKRIFTEVLPLASILAIAGLVLVFVLIANAVSDGATAAFDRRLLLLFRGDDGAAASPLWVVEIARDLTALGSTVVLTFVTVAALGYLLLTRKVAAALLVTAAVVGGAVINNLLKFSFARPRPDFVTPLAHVTSLSFPSGHTTLSAITYLTLAALLARTADARRLRFYLITLGIVLTMLVGTSRVFLGVHYPTDVLAGWCAGAAWALVCWSAMAFLQWEGQVEPPGQPAVPKD